MTTVSIVEDKSITRESLTKILNAAGFRCLSVHSNAEDAVRVLPENPPNVVIMDINLPRMSGIECVSRLKPLLPQTEFMMLTVEDDPDPIFDSLRAGANGYLLKTARADEIVESINELVAGGSPMSAGIARKVVAYFSGDKPPRRKMEALTDRECEILDHLAKGLQYKEIAETLGITIFGVRNHLHRIYGKLHVQSRTEAVVKFLRQ